LFSSARRGSRAAFADKSLIAIFESGKVGMQTDERDERMIGNALKYSDQRKWKELTDGCL
jgi:hypothetical protein